MSCKESYITIYRYHRSRVVIRTQDQHRSYVQLLASSAFAAAPQPPKNLVVTPTSNTLQAAVDAHAEAVSYNWYLDGAFVAETTDPTYTFADLVPETQYTIQASVTDALGISSALSEPAVFETLPPPVVVFAAERSDLHAYSLLAETGEVLNGYHDLISSPIIHSGAYDPNNRRLYITDMDNGFLWALDVDFNNAFSLAWRIVPSTILTRSPYVDADGFLYAVVYNGGYTVTKFDPADGSVIWSELYNGAFSGICLTPYGLVVRDSTTAYNLLSTADGSLIKTFAGLGTSDVLCPQCDKEGRLYYSNYGDGRVRKYDIPTEAVLATSSALNNGQQINVGKDYLLQSADGAGNRILRLSDLATVASNISMRDFVEFDSPVHGIVGSDGFIYTADLDLFGYHPDGTLLWTNTDNNSKVLLGTSLGRPYPFLTNE